MKKCYKCNDLKELSEFNKDKSRSDGYGSLCRKCNRLKDKLRWENNKESERIRNKKYRTENREKLNEKGRLYHHNNREQRSIKHREWVSNNRDKRAESNKRYVQNNLGKKYAHNKKRYANKIKRLPQWADLWKIEQYYIMAKKLSVIFEEKFHVDHIVPLQGELVSGLHVENNLQIITQHENNVKSNKFVPVING